MIFFDNHDDGKTNQNQKIEGMSISYELSRNIMRDVMDYSQDVDKCKLIVAFPNEDYQKISKIVSQEAFDYAIKTNDLEVAIMLLPTQDSQRKYTILKHAVRNGMLDIVKKMNEKHGTHFFMNGSNEFDIAAANGHIDIIKYICDNYYWKGKPTQWSCALRSAVQNNHVNIVKYMLKLKKISPSSTEYQILVIDAYMRKHAEMSKFLTRYCKNY